MFKDFFFHLTKKQVSFFWLIGSMSVRKIESDTKRLNIENKIKILTKKKIFELMLS